MKESVEFLGGGQAAIASFYQLGSLGSAVRVVKRFSYILSAQMAYPVR